MSVILRMRSLNATHVYPALTRATCVHIHLDEVKSGLYGAHTFDPFGQHTMT